MQPNEQSALISLQNIANKLETGIHRRPIINRDEIKLLETFIETGPIKSGFADIPVSSICSLNRHEDTWFTGQSWLDVINYNLIGKGWTKEIFTYFNSELLNNTFPTPGARGRLELTSYNGFVCCDNGNHRLPALLCYKVVGGSPDSLLPMVYCSFLKFNQNKLNEMIVLTNYGNSDLFVCPFRDYECNEFECLALIKIGDKVFRVTDKIELLYEETSECFSER